MVRGERDAIRGSLAASDPMNDFPRVDHADRIRGPSRTSFAPYRLLPFFDDGSGTVVVRRPGGCVRGGNALLAVPANAPLLAECMPTE
jgi:hypothetical protein